jgi:hypothetical protein
MRRKALRFSALPSYRAGLTGESRVRLQSNKASGGTSKHSDFILRQGDDDVPCAERLQYRLVDLAYRRIVVGYIDPRRDTDRDAGFGESCNSESWRRVLQHAGIGVQNFLYQAQGDVDIGAIGNSHRDVESPYTAIIVKNFADDFAVWDHNL